MLKNATSRLLCIGGLLAAAATGMALIAPEFHYGAPLNERPTALFIGLLMGAGGIFLLLLRVIPNCPPGARLLWLTLGIGLAMRVVQFAGPPIYENDFYRYLWDGAVTAQGLDPYAQTPRSIQRHRDSGALLQNPPDTKPLSQLDALAALSKNSGAVFERIGYPHLSTIYPPLAQAGFATAHGLAPFSLNAWRLVLLAAEIASIILLIQLLRISGNNQLWSLLYWWNPLIISEFANSAHMEPLLLPFLLGTFWALHRQRQSLAAIGLALAAAVKLWPLILLPSLIRREQPFTSLLKTLGFTTALALLLLWPQWHHLADAHSAGLVNYAADWQRNSFAFYWLSAGLSAGLPKAWNPDLIARILVAAAVGSLALILLTRPAQGMTTRAKHWCIVIAALFLLGPTGYPWYFAWFLPFLCLWRNPVLIALSVLLPLYYARFPLTGSGNHEVFQYGIVTLEFLPIWLGLAGYAWRSTQTKRIAATHAQ